jgi:hypothetical protein
VSSAGKISANRANARASTGPKTAQGRARSARNAHRHGLSLPVLADPALSEEVEVLAREIVGADARAEIQELARRFAEAQIDLCRVRRARHALLSSALGDPEYDSPRAARNKSKLAAYVAKRMARLTPQLAQTLMPLAAQVRSYVQSRPEGPQKFTTILSDMTQRLAAMDRYERRALVRRKFAIRAFDAARARAAPGRGKCAGT